MATKYLCDRCNRAVGSPDEFMHLTITNPPSMVTRQKVEAGKRVEICAECAVAVQKFISNAWAPVPEPEQPKFADIREGTRVLVPGIVIKAHGPEEVHMASRMARPVEITCLNDEKVEVVMPVEKLIKVHDLHTD